MGEFGLIARLTAGLARTDAVLLGPGDDAAVVATPDGRVVATTDLLVEGRHFRFDWSSARDVGRKAAAQSLADVLAMGACPTALLVGFGAPPGFPAAEADELVAGLADEAARAGAAVVGGDVVAAERVLLAVTALGDLEGRAPVTRSGACPGDAVWLLGTVGRAQGGLALLQHADTELLGRHRDIVAAHQVPRLPYDLWRLFVEAGATAMIDVSDGLLADAGHVAARSGVAIELDTAGLADAELSAAAADLGVDALGWQLAGGEDHGLLVTLPEESVGELVRTLHAWVVQHRWPGRGAAAIGRVAEGVGVTVDGRLPDIPGGWDHFRAEHP